MGLAVGLNLNFECSSTALLGSKLTQKYLPESGNRTRNRKRCKQRIRQTPQTTSTTNGSPATIQLLSIAHTAGLECRMLLTQLLHEATVRYPPVATSLARRKERRLFVFINDWFERLSLSPYPTVGGSSYFSSPSRHLNNTDLNKQKDNSLIRTSSCSVYTSFVRPRHSNGSAP